MPLHPQYRSDIDGLRAIAVLVVVLFHAFPTLVPGGFIGVDIFFVISGFLICTILYENLAAGQFSFSDFYARRIRRIFPALFLVLAACFGIGWFVLLPDEYAQLGRHMAAGAGFVQNLILWNEANYFDNIAETKPLLHLWSLGIEEQFYLIWPPILWLAYRCRINLLWITITIALASFVANLVWIGINPTATFYSPLTRFWELLAGATLAYLTLYGTSSPTPNKSNASNHPNALSGTPTLLAQLRSFLGLLCLLAGLVFIDKAVLFPGWWALLPVLGSMLLLSAGPAAWVNQRILSNRYLVWFGLISYPLYLWHWPLLSLARIMESEPPSPLLRTGLVLASVALATATYYCVEKPIRFGKHRKTKTIILVLLMIIIGFIGYNTDKRAGLGFRFAAWDFTKANDARRQEPFGRYGSAETFEHACDFSLHPQIAKSCYEPLPQVSHRVVLWGDSTAAMLTYGLIKNLPSNWQLQAMIQSGCQLFDEEQKAPKAEGYCENARRFDYQWMSINQPPLVIVSFRNRWTHERLQMVADQLHALGVKQILFVGNPPNWVEMGLPSFVFRKMHRPIPLRTTQGLDSSALDESQALERGWTIAGAQFVNLSSALCDSQGCQVYFGENVEQGISSMDRFHLSAIASDYVAKTVIVPAVLKTVPNSQ